jgi:hypothetical protein
LCEVANSFSGKVFVIKTLAEEEQYSIVTRDAQRTGAGNWEARFTA